MDNFDTLKYDSIQNKTSEVMTLFNHLIDEVKMRADACFENNTDAILVPAELLRDISYRLEDGKIAMLKVQHQEFLEWKRRNKGGV